MIPGAGGNVKKRYRPNAPDRNVQQAFRDFLQYAMYGRLSARDLDVSQSVRLKSWQGKKPNRNRSPVFPTQPACQSHHLTPSIVKSSYYKYIASYTASDRLCLPSPLPLHTTKQPRPSRPYRFNPGTANLIFVVGAATSSSSAS
jgi:hypothetical protein